MELLQQRKLLRLQGFDYSSEGAYFVTICTKNREHYFGEIKNGIMGLNKMGLIAHQFFQDIPDHFKYAILDEFVIMPDHVHGIIFIDYLDPVPQPVGVADLQPLRVGGRQCPNDRTKMALPKIIHGFKSSVTRTINGDDFDVNVLFAWQRSYHDRIIRDEDELNRIRKYIRYNPQNWGQDKNDLFWR